MVIRAPGHDYFPWLFRRFSAGMVMPVLPDVIDGGVSGML
jgi:hypothetical protein